MAENNENKQENCDYNKIDQMYEECLNYLQSVKKKYRALAQSEDGDVKYSYEKKIVHETSVEELNGGLKFSDDKDESEIELLEFYNKEMMNNEAVNEVIHLKADTNKMNDLEKKIQEIKDNNDANYDNKKENSVIDIFEIDKLCTEDINETREVIELKENTNKIDILDEKINDIKNNKEGIYENVKRDKKGIAILEIKNTNKRLVDNLKEGDSSNLDDVKSDEILITIDDLTEEVKNDDETSPLYESLTDNEPIFKIENEKEHLTEIKSERLRRLSEQLPRIIITQSNTSLDEKPPKGAKDDVVPIYDVNKNHVSGKFDNSSRSSSSRYRSPYIEYPKRLVSKHGVENVALISNVPYGKLRLLNDTFHTLINLRWRWIVTGTVVVHFTIWFVFAVFWYIASSAHYDFEPDPPQKACITGGKDFVTIFLASVEAQTTIGFGDRTIDEECPESIFLFIMQLILGTGLSGVLTCVVYAKLTRPEKLSRDGVGFSKKAVICMRDGKLCLMLRAWDLNYDHLISSDFSAHFVKTYRTKEGEYIRYYARTLELQQRQFLLWPVTIVHVIDENSPLYNMTPENFINFSYEITISLKGASASMGTYTQSQTSYLPREVLWGYRFPSVVKYDHRKQKYVIDRKKLDRIEQVDTPLCSANQLYRSVLEKDEATPWCPGTPSSFSEKITEFKLDRGSSFRRKHH